MNVGFLGLGLMGGPMARNLVLAGHDVTVWNRTPGPAEELAAAGATVARTPAELGARCEYIGCCLPNGAVVAEVLFGAEGALTAARPETVVFDHSTISSEDARALAQRCQFDGYSYLDAPISGGPEGAAAGALAVFVGGSTASYDLARPMIESYAATIVHLGGPGTGQVAKLANQIIISATVLGIAEAFDLATTRGVAPDKLLEVLAGATANSKMLGTRVPVPGLQPAMPASNDWRPGFFADFMAKDLDFALSEAADCGVMLRSTEIVREVLKRVQADGRGRNDWTVFSEYL